jgi:glycine cleavage system regulatory protein
MAKATLRCDAAADASMLNKATKALADELQRDEIVGVSLKL